MMGYIGLAMLEYNKINIYFWNWWVILSFRYYIAISDFVLGGSELKTLDDLDE